MIATFFSSTLNKVLTGVITLAVVFGAVQTTRLAWSEAQIERMKADRDRAIVEAVMKAVKAEREAQAKFTEREQERETTTRDLREAAAKAPVGEKTEAVFDALRAGT